jgi:crossover junction endodeoxyribonuclease RusA
MTVLPDPQQVLNDSIAFRVFGTPGAQGSKKGWAIKRGGEYTGQVAQSENSKKVAPWRSDVKQAAQEVIGDDWTPWEGPCEVAVIFIFKRPKSHYRTGRNAHLLKDNAPFYVIGHSQGDLDKLLRSTFDALTAAGVWKDDALAARIGPTIKVYGEREGARIFVRRIEDKGGEWEDG